MRNRECFIVIAVLIIFCGCSRPAEKQEPIQKQEQVTDLIRDNKFFGIYLPVNFIDVLHETKNYSDAKKHFEANEYYDFIMVNGQSVIRSGFYKVSEGEFQSWQFQDKSGKIEIIDNFENKYLKISDDMENFSIIINSYIGDIILDELIKNGKMNKFLDLVSISQVNDRNFRIDAFDFRAGGDEDANLCLYDIKDKEWVYLEINNNKYQIYGYKNNEKEILWIL